MSNREIQPLLPTPDRRPSRGYGPLRWVACAVGSLTLLGLFATSSAAGEKARRQKVIDFDDEVVEGLNKRPLDSLSQISERDKRRKRSHLYRKRGSFRSEIAETLRALRYTP